MRETEPTGPPLNEPIYADHPCGVCGGPLEVMGWTTAPVYQTQTRRPEPVRGYLPAKARGSSLRAPMPETMPEPIVELVPVRDHTYPSSFRCRTCEEGA